MRCYADLAGLQGSRVLYAIELDGSQVSLKERSSLRVCLRDVSETPVVPRFSLQPASSAGRCQQRLLLR